MFWPEDKWEVSEPIVTEHTYENRLQTLSHWGKLSEIEIKENDLFWYPTIGGGWLATTILTNGPKFPKSDMYFRYLNGYLNTDKGGYKKTRIWVLIWNNQPQVVANYQRRYWKGGNKNEFIIMLGTNDNQDIAWADIMTWSEADAFTVNVRDKILLEMAEGKNGFSGKLTDEDLLKFAQWFGDTAKVQYVKPSFKEQNEMIDVQPSNMALVISFCIIMVVNCGVGLFIIKNSWNDYDYRRW